MTAEAHARRAIEAEPTLAEAHHWSAYALFLLNRPADGMRAARRARELDPRDYFASYLPAVSMTAGQSRPEALEKVAVLGGPSDLDDPHSWLRREAVKLSQNVVDLNPQFRWGWLNLGWAHLELGALGEARWSIERAVELEPKTTPPTGGIVGYLGECLRRSGDLAESRQAFLDALEAVETTDYMYRDLWRGLFLCGLGRTALEQSDTEAARATFTQAMLHIKDRSQARCSGQVLLQALAGVARTDRDSAPFEEALGLLESREGYDFTGLWGCSEDVALLELSRAGLVLGRNDLAGPLLKRARDHGASEPI